MRSSKGRHGGGGGQTDKGEALNQRIEARRNTDSDSPARNRNTSRARGKRRG